MIKNKTTYLKILSVVIAIVIWQIAAMTVGNDMLFASPIKVLVRLASVWREKDFIPTVLFSFLRITSGYLCALVLGIILGTAAGKVRLIEILFKPYIAAAKAVPVASFIILFLIWLNYNALTVLISFLIAFPVIYTNVLQGIRSVDPKMKELVSLYGIPWKKQIVYIYIPSVKPYLLSAASVSVGMAWKAGVAAEVIGMIDGSIGDMLYQAKIYLQNADLLCWTLIIIILSIASEKLLSLLLKAFFKGVERL